MTLTGNTFEPIKREMALLGYPFDLYQRYEDVRRIVDIIQSRHPGDLLNILDVGGSPAATKFFPNYRVVAANIETAVGVKLQCDGSRLPYRNESFEVVITADTLEHVNPDQREAFVSELLRVTKLCAIITAPFANGYNEAAEAMLDEFLQNVISLKHRFLQEHLQNGLPALEDCLRWVAKASAHYLAIPSGYLHHWLPLMIIRHYLSRLSDGHGIMEELDRLYNYQCYWSDHRLPSYRQIVVVYKGDVPDILTQVKNAFESSPAMPAPDLNGVIALAQAINGLQHLEERDNEIKRLKKLVLGYESGRFIGFMAKVNQLIGLIKK